MKKHISIILTIVLIIFIHHTAFGQFTKTSNNFLIWSSGGISKFINDAPSTNTAINFGSAVGVGYEVYLNSCFLRFGTELCYNSSEIRLKDTAFVKQMKDSESILFNANFTFKNTADFIKITNVGIPIQIGYESPKRNFYSIGGKFMINLGERSRTSTIVTKTATYSDIIGDYNDGTLSNMPNHGLTTNKRIVNSKSKLGQIYFGSLEMGHTFVNNSQAYELKMKPRLRVSVFFDYGIAPITINKESIFVNNSKTDEYIPAIKDYVLNEKNSSYIGIFYLGVKISAVFGVTKYKCKCKLKE